MRTCFKIFITHYLVLIYLILTQDMREGPYIPSLPRNKLLRFILIVLIEAICPCFALCFSPGLISRINP